jgi:uncharacterized integral membrane protein
MADPDHRPDMDAFDGLTVGLYRAGLLLAGLSCIGVAVVAGLRVGQLFPPWWVGQLVWALVGASAALSAATVHLYDKRIRWVLASAAPVGLALQLVAAVLPPEAWVVEPLQAAGVGFAGVTLSGLALKERFCFKLPGLRAVPVLWVAGLVPLLVDWPVGLLVAFGAVGLVLVALAVAKLLQPMDFDIGDKSRYQV